jgi:hypothetical protein
MIGAKFCISMFVLSALSQVLLLYCRGFS